MFQPKRKPQPKPSAAQLSFLEPSDELLPEAKSDLAIRPSTVVRPQAQSADVQQLGNALNSAGAGRLHLGTSSWSFPGWQGLVWDSVHSAAALSKHGLPAYCAHPLLRAVSLDSSFYRPLPEATFARYAGQVPPEFRFVVKAPALVCDALIRPRADNGFTKSAPNPDFLNAKLARSLFVEPALGGLGSKAGALVFQLSPLPGTLLRDVPSLIARLHAFMLALPPTHGTAHAVELRNPQLLTPEFAAALKAANWRFCLGLHDLMPPIDEQLPLLRALWPGDFVCRWNLQRGLNYEAAYASWEPFNRLAAPDVATRKVLARIIAGTLAAGSQALVTINNKAEGCAPLSVRELAREALEALEAHTTSGAFEGRERPHVR